MDSSEQRSGTSVGRFPFDGGIPRTQNFCDILVDRLPANGVSLVVRSGPDNSQLIYASDAVIAALDELQFTLSEGPCLDAYRTSSPVHVDDMNGQSAFTRWPGFAHEAGGLGAAAVFAYPLQIGSVPFGTVEFYRSKAGSLSESARSAAARAIAGLVPIVLDELTEHGRLDHRGGMLPLLGHAEVAQATGMIAVQLGVSIPEALARLRASAFAERNPIQEIARDVIARRRRFNSRHR